MWHNLIMIFGVVGPPLLLAWGISKAFPDKPESEDEFWDRQI